jgi:glycosyltransferase involved in cell wall biosynthesis
MAVGRAVVAAAIPGVLEMLEGAHAGILIPPEDPVALAAAIDALARDVELRRELGRNARDLVAARYALPVVHARIIEFLRHAADRERPPERGGERFG